MIDYRSYSCGSLTHKLLQQATPYVPWSGAPPTLRYEGHGAEIRFGFDEKGLVESIVLKSKGTNRSLDAVESFYAGSPNPTFALLLNNNVGIQTLHDYSFENEPQTLSVIAHQLPGVKDSDVMQSAFGILAAIDKNYAEEIPGLSYHVAWDIHSLVRALRPVQDSISAFYLGNHIDISREKLDPYTLVRGIEYLSASKTVENDLCYKVHFLLDSRPLTYAEISSFDDVLRVQFGFT